MKRCHDRESTVPLAVYPEFLNKSDILRLHYAALHLRGLGYWPGCLVVGLLVIGGWNNAPWVYNSGFLVWRLWQIQIIVPCPRSARCLGLLICG